MPPHVVPANWRADRTMGVIGLLMWAGTIVRVFHLLTWAENLQAFMGLVYMGVVVVFWPTFYLPSYLRWRIPALAFLRVGLFAMPFNFSTEVFDAIAPDVNTGRLALVSNFFQLSMAIRIALLTFTSVGWRVPHRLHMVLQAINVCMLIKFGLHNYCRSKLLTSPEMETAIASVHSLIAFSAAMFVPSTGILAPEGVDAQRVAFLLLCWAIFGWLVPTLLLLPEAELGSSDWQQQQRRGGRAVGILEAWLRMLAPLSQGTEDGAPGGRLPAVAAAMLHWCAVVLVVWGICCSAAPLFVPPASSTA